MSLISKKQMLLMSLCCFVGDGLHASKAGGLAGKGVQKFTKAQLNEIAIAKKMVVDNTVAFLNSIPKSTTAAKGLSSAEKVSLAKFNKGFENEIKAMPEMAIVSLLPQAALQNQQAAEQAVKKLFQDVYVVEAYLYNQDFFTRMVSNLNNLRTNKLIQDNPASTKLLEGSTKAVILIPATPASSIVPLDDQIAAYLSYVQYTQASAQGLLQYAGSSKPLTSVNLPEQQLFLTAGLVGSEMFTQDLSNYAEIMASLADVYQNAGIIGKTNIERNVKIVTEFFTKHGTQIQSYTEDVIANLMKDSEETLLNILDTPAVETGLKSAQDFVKGLPGITEAQVRLFTLITKKYVVGAFEAISVQLVELSSRSEGEMADIGVGAGSGEQSKMNFDFIPTEFVSYLKFLLGLSAGVATVDAVGTWSEKRKLEAQETAARDALQAAFQLEFAKQEQAANLAKIQAAIDETAAGIVPAEKFESFELPKLVTFTLEDFEQFINELKESLVDRTDVVSKQILARLQEWSAQVKAVDYQQVVQNLRAYAAERSDVISKKILEALEALPTIDELKAVDYVKFIQALRKHLADNEQLFRGDEFNEFKNLREMRSPMLVEDAKKIANEVGKYFESLTPMFMKLAAQVATSARLYSVNFKKSAIEIIQNIHDQVKAQNPGLAEQLQNRSLLLMPKLGSPVAVEQLYLIGYCKEQAAHQHATGLITPGAKGILAKSQQFQKFAQVATVVNAVTLQYGPATGIAFHSGVWSMWQKPKTQTRNYVDQLMSDPKIQQQLSQEAAPVKMIEGKPTQTAQTGILTQADIAKIRDLSAFVYEHKSVIKEYMDKAADAIETTEGLTPEMVVNNTIQLADGTSLPALENFVPDSELQDVKEIIQAGIEILIDQDRGTTETLELMPSVAKEAIEEVWQEGSFKKVFNKPSVSKMFVASSRKYGMKLAQALLSAGIKTITSQDVRAAIEKEGIDIIGLSNPNNMAYLMGHVQMKLWMLQANAPQANVSRASVWPVIELVSFLRA
ncbi:MAG: hypothetical protein WC747_03865 [Candidatus Babeliales bacterium]|jgi:hypothetical protein